MILQAVLSVPDGTDVFAQDDDGHYLIGDEVFAQLALMQPQWPGGKFPGCRPFNGRELVHALLDTDADDPDTLIDALIDVYELDWQLLALCSLDNRPQYDANGDPVTEDIDDGEGGTITTQVQAQDVYRAIPEATLLDYLADVPIDDLEPPTMGRPTSVDQRHGWSFALPVAVG